MEAYFTIMNVLDEHALNGKELTPNTILFLDCLADIGEHEIPDIADANDCGRCSTWSEVVSELAENFKSGNRICI